MRRLLRWTGRVLATALLAATTTAAWLTWASLPAYDGTRAVAGLSGPVEIERDGYAIPTIRAQSAEDAYMALGYVHAQDRLWQMELQRRVGQGRLAEIVGATALPIDRYMRVLGLARLAEASVAYLDARSLALLEAYTRGVNAGMAALWALPPEFQVLWHMPEPWRAVDSLLIARLMAVELGGGWRRDALRARLAERLRPDQLDDLWPQEPVGVPITLPEAGPRRAGPEASGWLAAIDWGTLLASLPAELPPALGSNVFVVAGSRTASGKPLLASDPHLGLRMPGHWYLAQLEAPSLHVLGGTIPGMPVVVIGRNAEAAWGLTNTAADTEDLFIERVDPTDPDRYLTPAASELFVTRSEDIHVRGGTTERLTIRATRHGLVISDVAAGARALPSGESSPEVVALAWSALAADDTTLAAGFDLATARSLDDLHRALRRFTAPVQNVAMADRQGALGLLTAGRIPVRQRGDGRLPVPGWTGEFDWIGTVPFDELPFGRDPVDGLLINANNRVVGPDYPHLITADWDSPLRAARLEELLRPQQDLTPERAATVQLDVLSMLARDFLPLLRTADAADGRQQAMLDALRVWDGRMEADRPEPLLFTAWYAAFVDRVYRDELGPLFDAFRGIRADFLRRVISRRQVWCDDVTTQPVETCEMIAARAFSEIVPALLAHWGDDWTRWRWGEAHKAQLAHQPFDRLGLLRQVFSRETGLGGDAATVNVASFTLGEPAGPFPATHAAGLRLIADLADGAARVVAATGQSGHPLSRHFDDLTGLWASGRYVSLDLQASSRATPSYRMRLSPTVDGLR